MADDDDFDYFLGDDEAANERKRRRFREILQISNLILGRFGSPAASQREMLQLDAMSKSGEEGRRKRAAVGSSSRRKVRSKKQK